MAVGDASAAQLVRAREATRLPGYQHLHEMARGAEYEALLLERPSLAQPLAEIAAERGADLLVRAASVDGDTLGEIAEAAARHHVALVTLRPALRLPGFALVAATAGAEPGWRPALAELSIEGPATAEELLRDAVGALVRLLPSTPIEALATAVDPPPGARAPAEGPYGAAAQLRYAEGRVASIVTREAPQAALRLRVAAPLGTVALDARAGWARLSFAAASVEGEREDEESELSGAEALVAEAIHVRTCGPARAAAGRRRRSRPPTRGAPRWRRRRCAHWSERWPAAKSSRCRSRTRARRYACWRAPPPSAAPHAAACGWSSRNVPLHPSGCRRLRRERSAQPSGLPRLREGSRADRAASKRSRRQPAPAGTAPELRPPHRRRRQPLGSSGTLARVERNAR